MKDTYTPKTLHERVVHECGGRLVSVRPSLGPVYEKGCGTSFQALISGMPAQVICGRKIKFQDTTYLCQCPSCRPQDGVSAWAGLFRDPAEIIHYVFC